MAEAVRQTSSLPRPAFLPFRVSDEVYSLLLLLWLRGAEYHEIARQAVLPLAVVKACTTTAEWMDAADRLRPRMRREDRQVNVRLSAIAARKLEERLIHGDEHVTKDGDVVKKAVGARDCAAIMEITAERGDKIQRTIDGVPEPNSSSALEDLFRVATALLTGQQLVQQKPTEHVIEGTATIEAQVSLPDFTEPIAGVASPVPASPVVIENGEHILVVDD